MSIQAQLNNAAFEMLPLTRTTIKTAKDGATRGSLEYIALNAVARSYPCLADMSQEQKQDLDAQIISAFQMRGYCPS